MIPQMIATGIGIPLVASWILGELSTKPTDVRRIATYALVSFAATGLMLAATYTPPAPTAIMVTAAPPISPID